MRLMRRVKCPLFPELIDRNPAITVWLLNLPVPPPIQGYRGTFLRSRDTASRRRRRPIDRPPDMPCTLYDLPAMLAQLQARPKGGPNPFIVGPSEYQKFLGTMELCSEANVARRK